MKPRCSWTVLSGCLKRQFHCFSQGNGFRLGRLIRGPCAINVRCYGTACSYSWRTHTCGELRRENIDQNVCLCGWLQFKRNSGRFATLRDAYGVTQLLFSSEIGDIVNQMDKVSLESVLQVSGVVKLRPTGQESKIMDTGAIEVWVEQLKILNESKARLPFIPRKFQEVNEPLRLQYRYIDLRNPVLQANLRLRSNFTLKTREFLCGREFIDVETPTLFRQTPGGAHEFVVPTKHQDMFYALTQSPQQFKQLLMVGGLDRYFQIARCYRDETSRPDRQPEFTQIDIEMSFVTPDGIYSLVEEMLHYCWPSHLPTVTTPFPKMTHAEAINSYGSDKPDTRFEIKIQAVPDFLENCMPFFQGEASSDICTKAIVVPHFAPFFVKNIQNKFFEEAKNNYKDAKLAFVKIDPDFNWTTSLKKYMDENVQSMTKQAYDLHPGDVVVFCFGKRNAVHSLLGKLRLECANLLEENGHIVRDPNAQHFLWITDFPLFEQNEEGTFESMHHPFTAPHPDDVGLIYTNPSQVRAQHYDLVLNGAEIGGGSIRIHNSALQKYIINDILKEDLTHLNHLTEALESGCPPHGGIALGLDRLITIMCQAPSIRDVIAFPKSLDGKDLMANAPAKISDADKKRYHLK